MCVWEAARHCGNARQEGRRINGKGGEARKERHGKERRHGGRPRQRTAEHWAAGKRLGGGEALECGALRTL